MYVDFWIWTTSKQTKYAISYITESNELIQIFQVSWLKIKTISGCISNITLQKRHRQSLRTDLSFSKGTNLDYHKNSHNTSGFLM